MFNFVSIALACVSKGLFCVVIVVCFRRSLVHTCNVIIFYFISHFIYFIYLGCLLNDYLSYSRQYLVNNYPMMCHTQTVIQLYVHAIFDVADTLFSLLEIPFRMGTLNFSIT